MNSSHSGRSPHSCQRHVEAMFDLCAQFSPFAMIYFTVPHPERSQNRTVSDEGHNGNVYSDQGSLQISEAEFG